jgi:hypothetical protein
MQSCDILFNALKTYLTGESIKFCRRVGEKGPATRPLAVGFYDERDKTRLLR